MASGGEKSGIIHAGSMISDQGNVADCRIVPYLAPVAVWGDFCRIVVRFGDVSDTANLAKGQGFLPRTPLPDFNRTPVLTPQR